jgi:hypothetical protein
MLSPYFSVATNALAASVILCIYWLKPKISRYSAEA